ncbi:MAG: HlyD family efflux transporter periplasmic adaptor subunit [Bryobacteraceae bacterium]
MGTSGLGSTSTSGGIGSGGGGGGGGGDWMMVIEELKESGARVSKGDVVAAFDRQYMQTRLDDYQDTVTQAEASFRTLKANLEVTRKAYEQSVRTVRADLEKARLDLKTIPVQSAITTETLKLAEEEANARQKEILAEARYVDEIEQSRLRLGQSELKEAHNELRRVQANIDRMVVKAPLDGIAVVQPIIRGTEFTTIQAGDQLWPGQLFMKVVDPNSMIVNTFVNQADVEAIRIGARARVRFDAYPDLELPAHVYSVGALGRTGRFRANFLSEIPVTFRLDKMDPRVIPDLSVSVDVVVGSESGPALAPREALFTDSGADTPYVFVQGPSGWDKREVTVGLMNNTTAVVRSGLRPGEVLAAERPPERIKTQ